MFFKTTEFTVSNLSAFDFSWDRNVGNSGERPFHALSFRVSGGAAFSFAGETIHAGSGDLLFVPARCCYHMTAKTERVLVIHFNTDLPIADKIQKLTPRHPLIYQQYFEKMADCYAKKEVGYEYECKSLLYTIITHLERESSHQDEAYCDDEIQHAVRYIHQTFAEKPIPVGELAALCSMSETYFRKRFAKVCGCSPLSYINTLRTERAIEMLRAGYYTVSEVSEKCGFSSPYYFSAFIKKQTGYSPSEFVK